MTTASCAADVLKSVNVDNRKRVLPGTIAVCGAGSVRRGMAGMAYADGRCDAHCERKAGRALARARAKHWKTSSQWAVGAVKKARFCAA